MAAAFELAGVRVRFGGALVLDVGALAFPAGAVTLLAGPNGSGKTTLLRVMAGLLPPAEGEVRCMGAPVAYGRAGLAHRRRVTLLAQDPFLFRGSVLANAAYGPRARGARGEEAEAAARGALEAMGCAHLAGRDARALSGGERKRVALARALAAGAEALLLDEPASEVDRGSAERLREAIAALAASGKTLVVSTHQPEWAASVAAAEVRLAYGRVVPAG